MKLSGKGLLHVHEKTSISGCGAYGSGASAFVACTCGIMFFDSGVPVPNLLMALVIYGAVSLSFIGAVHWGLALELDRAILTSGADRADNLRLVLGVVPAFAGWIAAYLAYAWVPLAGVIILAVLFPLVALAERGAWQRAGCRPAIWACAGLPRQ